MALTKSQIMTYRGKRIRVTYIQNLVMSEISCKATNHYFNKTVLAFAYFFALYAHHTRTGQAFNLTLTMNVSNLWKHCYRLTYTCFYTVKIYVV